MFGYDRLKHTFLLHLFTSFFALHAFFMPITRLTINDTKYGSTYVVEGVPLGLGYTAHFGSNLSHWLTNIFDSINHQGTVMVRSIGKTQLTASMDYDNTGLAGTFAYAKELMNVDTKKMVLAYPKQTELMKTYIDQCYWLEVSSRPPEYALQTFTGQDILDSIKPTSSWFMNYNGQLTTCDYFYLNILMPEWLTMQSDVSATPEKLGFDRLIADKMVASLNALAGANADFAQAVTLAGVSKIMQESYENVIGKEYPHQMLAAYGSGRAQEQAKLTGIAFGEYAKDIMPLFKTFVESLAYFLAPVVAVLVLLPIGGKPIIGYIKFILWVYMWDPIFAIINGFTNIAAITKISAFLEAQGLTGLSLASSGEILAQAGWMPALAGYMAMSTPMLARLAVEGFENGIAGFASIFANLGQGNVANEANPSEIMKNAKRDRLGALAGNHNDMSSMTSEAAKWYQYQNENLPGIYDSVSKTAAHEQMEKVAGGVGGVVGGMTAASMANLANSMSHGKATEKVAGELGGYGSYMDHQSAAEITKKAKELADATAFRSIAEKYGYSGFSGQMEFATNLLAMDNAMKAGNYTQANEYAQKMGLSLTDLSGKLGQTEMASKLGGFQGLNQAFDNAKQNGFKGDLEDFIAISSLKSYSDNAAIQSIADKHFGGDVGKFLQTQADMHQSNLAGAIKTLETKGYNPETMSYIKGNMQALSDIGQNQAYKQLGDKGLITAGRDELLEKGAKFIAAEQMASKLGMEPYKFFKQQHSQGSIVLDDKAAAVLNSDMRSQGLRGEFKAGERVSLGFNNGHFTVAQGTVGSSHEQMNKTYTDTRDVKYTGSEYHIGNEDIISAVIDNKNQAFMKDAFLDGNVPAGRIAIDNTVRQLDSYYGISKAIDSGIKVGGGIGTQNNQKILGLIHVSADVWQSASDGEKVNMLANAAQKKYDEIRAGKGSADEKAAVMTKWFNDLYQEGQEISGNTKVDNMGRGLKRQFTGAFGKSQNVDISGVEGP